MKRIHFWNLLKIGLINLCTLATFHVEASLRNPIASPAKSTTQSRHHPFVIFSPPKCGTHLVGKTLSLLVNENPAYYLTDLGNSITDSLNIVASEEAKGCYVVGHHFTNLVLRTLINKGYKILFVVRDPRDQLISIVNWLKEGQWHWLPISGITNQSEQISEAISGSIFGWKSIDACFLSFENQLTGLPQESICKVHFEKLVGPHGKGNAEEQFNEIFKIANHLGMTISTEKILHVAENLFGGTKTFRDGSIGKWKNTFTNEQKAQFRVRYNYLLLRLGYEVNSEW